jgi:hypothetical protein
LRAHAAERSDDALHVGKDRDPVGFLRPERDLGTPPQAASGKQDLALVSDLESLILKLFRLEIRLLHHLEAELPGYFRDHPRQPDDVGVSLDSFSRVSRAKVQRVGRRSLVAGLRSV